MDDYSKELYNNGKFQNHCEVKRDIYLEKHINYELTWESVSNALLTITGSDFLVATMPALPREQKRKKKL